AEAAAGMDAGAHAVVSAGAAGPVDAGRGVGQDGPGELQPEPGPVSRGPPRMRRGPGDGPTRHRAVTRPVPRTLSVPPQVAGERAAGPAKAHLPAPPQFTSVFRTGARKSRLS